jgi:hypothetical protein
VQHPFLFIRRHSLPPQQHIFNQTALPPPQPPPTTIFFIFCGYGRYFLGAAISVQKFFDPDFLNPDTFDRSICS